MAVYKGYFQTVYLVNGLNYSYKVEINGIAHELPAMGHVAVKVAEGKVRVRPVGQGLGLQGQDCTIRTPFCYVLSITDLYHQSGSGCCFVPGQLPV